MVLPGRHVSKQRGEDREGLSPATKTGQRERECDVMLCSGHHYFTISHSCNILSLTFKYVPYTICSEIWLHLYLLSLNRCYVHPSLSVHWLYDTSLL